MGVSFPPLTGLLMTKLGTLQARFPDLHGVQEVPPYQPILEDLEGKPAPGHIRFELASTPLLPRVWFLNDSQTDLVQIQRDWFARNWRKIEADESYPHFDSLFPRFREDFGAFLSFVASEEIGEVLPIQCELTYINHIRQDGIWEQHSDAHRVLALLAEPQAQDLPALEIVRISSQYLLAETEAQPYGRLYVTFEPVHLIVNSEPIFVLTLSAKGRPVGEGKTGVFTFLEKAHEVIVTSFKALTTAAMHKVWEIEDA